MLMCHRRIGALLVLAGLVVFCQACVMGEKEFAQLAPGMWRAELELKPDARLPFNFEVTNTPTDTAGKARITLTIINGAERIVVPEVVFVGRDSLVIPFAHYDTYIKARWNPTAMEGLWISELGKGFRIPFKANAGRSNRFPVVADTAHVLLTGRWAVTFEESDTSTFPAVGLFEQEGFRLTGTFLTETGDFRYLEGFAAQDRKHNRTIAKLSCFDGSHAFLFEFQTDGSDDVLSGVFRSGATYQALWTAHRDPLARLRPAESLTVLRGNQPTFQLSLPDAEGRIVALTDERYRGKVKAIQIMGTWCPNCADEAVFLEEYYRQHRGADFEVLALSFEKHTDPTRAQAAIERFRQRLGVTYPVLLAGQRDKRQAAATLGVVEELIAYPTLLLIDRSNRVRYTHAGFSGPATGAAYDEFKRTFDAQVRRLIDER